MKKLLSVLLALMIMLSCVCAFAENSTVQSNLTEFDFGDFTMTLDEDILGEVYEKANNEIYFEIYPLFDENAEFHSTINCVWSAETEDFTQVDATEYANVILDGILNAMDATNGEVLLAMSDWLDGKYSQCHFIRYELDGTTMYLIQMRVSDAAFGYYAFTAAFTDETHIKALTDILYSVKWKE